MHNSTDSVHRGDEIIYIKSKLVGVVMVFACIDLLEAIRI